MEHNFGRWNPFKDRACSTCSLSESNITTDCIGKPFGGAERLWLLAFEEDLCDYVGDQWVDWAGKPTGNDIVVLRQRSEVHVMKKKLEGTRGQHLKAKMAMEDELLTYSQYNHWNNQPYDD